MNVIGIDLGTTGICGIKLDVKSGTVLASKTVNSNAFVKTDLEYEKIQSPKKIISISTEILDSLIDPSTVAIGVTGQMHGIVYLDKNGKCISPLYTWQDERGNLPYKDTTYAKYLNGFSGYGNVTDFFNRENNIRSKDAVCYSTIHSYFVMTLTGAASPTLHASDAASFGNFNIEANNFSYDIDVEVTNGYTVKGTYKGIPVSVAIGDNQASVFSTLTDEKGILINVGTGSQVSAISNKPLTAQGIETRPYFENKYLLVGAALCGGRAYSILKDFFKAAFEYISPVDDDTVYAIMNRMLEKNSAPLTVDTRFAGTRFDPALTGSITNVTSTAFTPEALASGFISGMVNELYFMYEQMCISAESIVASGNGIRKNPYLTKGFEDVFGLKIKMPVHMEEAAVGAALYAGIAAGKFKNSQDAQRLIKYQ